MRVPDIFRASNASYPPVNSKLISITQTLGLCEEDLGKFEEEGITFGAEQEVIYGNNIKYLSKIDAEIEKFKQELDVKSTNPLNTIQAYEKQRDVE